jgi:hypothetical protein
MIPHAVLSDLPTYIQSDDDWMIIFLLLLHARSLLRKLEEPDILSAEISREKLVLLSHSHMLTLHAEVPSISTAW